MRRLTRRQRIAIKKYSILILSIAIISSVFLSIPSVAKALPESLASMLTEKQNARDSSALPDDNKLTSLMGDPFSVVLGYDYETEPEIPPNDNLEGAEYVEAVNLCWYTIEEKPELFLMNRTNFKINLNDYKNLKFPIDNKINSAPAVLIVHTHGTESYLSAGVDYYTAGENFRSEDQSKNVVGVGTVLAQELEKRGIATVHDTTMHDKNNFSASYSNSRKAVTNILAKYPSIKYVIDLHRDAVFTAKGVNQKPVTKIDGKEVAQIMLVVGTNQGGANHPNWKKNLTVAVALQSIINEDYPTLARPLCLRSASFNQQLSLGSFLIEVGSCGNTVEEAKNAVKLFASAFAEMIYSK